MSKPIGTDERLDKIAQLNAEIERLQAALDRADEWRKEHLYDEPCGCAYDTPDDWCLGHLPKLRELEAAQAEVERLRAVMNQIDDELVDAWQDDCENGVKSLNERAAASYLHDYRHTKAAITKVIELVCAALETKA